MKIERNSFFALLLILILLTIIPAVSYSQDTPDSTNAVVSQDSVSQLDSSDENKMEAGKVGFNAKTLMGLMRVSMEIGYLLAVIFALGILFIFQKWFVLLREGKDAKKIPVDQIKTMSYDDISDMFKKVREDEAFTMEQESEEKQKVPLLKRLFKQKKASAFQLMHKLFLIFETQKSTSAFNDETANFIQYLKDMFNPFLTRLYYLSDTAGGLGLLGTVWGMFLVFYGGNPDSSGILQGMGIALATTIIGLVVSIILNSFTTVVSNIFDKHLDVVNKMANVFQERLMAEEELQPIRAPQVIIDPAAMSNLPQPQIIPKQTKKKQELEEIEEPQQTIPKAAKFGPPAEIKLISGDNQSGEVNSELGEPIIVEVVDARGNPIENKTIIFSAEDGGGMFSNDSNIQKVLTDDEGRAQAKLTLGRTSGEKTIQVSLEGNTTPGINLLTIAKPTPPKKLIELGGNYQTGELGKRLNNPFVVAVKDNYDNPIPRHEVSFNLIKGTGKFQDSQNSTFSTVTNEKGLVEVYFVIGNNRGAQEIEVEAKKVSPSKINFEAFAK